MLKSGSVTGYQVASDEDGTVLTITGLSISASKIADAAATVTNLHDDRAVIKQFFAGADQIAGSRYVDQLNGFAGNDVINGGLGRDILTGGAGADIFVFTKGSGADVITDFNANNSSASHDLIDLSVYQGIDDFSDLSVHKAAGDVVLDLGADRIILNDVKVASIDAGDFSF
jgi:Ca2+-binding RTX toxin-like protein